MANTISSASDLNIDFATMKDLASFMPVYDGKEDTLFLRPAVQRPATSVDWEGQFWVRIDVETGEIVGLEIENFERVFLKRHPELAPVWKQIKPLCKKKPARCDEPALESFLRVFMQFVSDFMKSTPQQTRMYAI